MVNPERLHNAFAALDILARADSAAFERGRRDESEETRERHEGKLSKTAREGIGEVGSEHRENMPESAFLEPASRKYPVKEKRDGEWVYTRNLLLAAARRARLEHDESLAAKADKIREREFGSSDAPKNDSSRHWRGSYVTKDGTTKTVTVMALDAASAARTIANLRDFARATGSPTQRSDAARKFKVGDKVTVSYGRNTTKDGVISYVSPAGGKWDYGVTLANGKQEMARENELRSDAAPSGCTFILVDGSVDQVIQHTGNWQSIVAREVRDLKKMDVGKVTTKEYANESIGYAKHDSVRKA